MELSFTTLDVFSTKRFEGNPLAVVSIPAALKSKISQSTKQKIAKEFNLSETVFLHEPLESNPNELYIDIFTVESELPFAGHPTIGTAVLVKHHLYPSVETFVAKCGPISLAPGNGNGGGKAIKAKIPHDVHLHQKTLADVIPLEQRDTYPGLSHHSLEIREAELNAPVFSIVKGMTFVLVKLLSVEVLGQVRPGRLDFNGLPEAFLDKDWAESFVARYYYVETPSSDVKDDGARLLRTRMLELGPEDPATGSAASSLAAYLTLSEKSPAGKYLMVQGVEIGRRSVINVDTMAEDGENGFRLKDLWLGGEAVVVNRGLMVLD
ncbi:uncharacterized protein BCR38DRAFT_489625 [Pseudomassariella vexata]|uniref:Phenazine biosynthesis-like protein n=1 Tax=Pseudomassariella vexata TaxID=1141098 RepID=A0A1Y2DHD2_9PEZI|nr:uncharacterized protein BCR38DRAFT_489625 [Pseudomassariella vexata]ORY58145.1 hypothetical protein BCR38DRAFT_489625 [Pseudomassariella vexata]